MKKQPKHIKIGPKEYDAFLGDISDLETSMSQRRKRSGVLPMSALTKFVLAVAAKPGARFSGVGYIRYESDESAHPLKMDCLDLVVNSQGKLMVRRAGFDAEGYTPAVEVTAEAVKTCRCPMFRHHITVGSTGHSATFHGEFYDDEQRPLYTFRDSVFGKGDYVVSIYELTVERCVTKNH